MDPSTAGSKGWRGGWDLEEEEEQEQTEEEFYDCQETLEVLNKERAEGGEEGKREEDDAERSLQGGEARRGGLVCGHHTQTDLPEPGQGVGGQSVCDGTGEEERTDEGATEEELQCDDEVGGRTDSGAAPKVEKNEAVEKNLTEEERESCRQESLALKEEGNGRFKAAEHREAERYYTEALGVCPVCFSSDRAVLFSNRAAARLHLDLKDQAIADCSRAVVLNPDYVRALLRRAELYEKTDKLDEALGDYKTDLEKEPGQNAAREACLRLPWQIRDRDENMKEEMLGNPIRDGDHPIRDGDNLVQGGHHPVRDGDHPFLDGDHPIRDGDHPIRDGDHPVRDRYQRSRDRNHHSRDRYYRSQVTDDRRYCSRDRDRCSRDRDHLIRDRNHRIRDWDYRFQDRDHCSRDRDHRSRDTNHLIRGRDQHSRDRDRERDRDGQFRRSDSYPERRGVRKGNTVYVCGGLAEDSLRPVFSPLGNIIHLRVDNVRNCAFITFEKMESADQAVAELNGSTVEDVHIKVSIARKQSMLDAATGKSAWAYLAVQNSTKDSYDEKRNVVCSEEFL